MGLNKLIEILILLIAAMSILCAPAAFLLMLPLFALLIFKHRATVVLRQLLSDKGMLALVFAIAASTLLSKIWTTSLIFAVLYLMTGLYCFTLTRQLGLCSPNKLFRVLNMVCLLACIIGIGQYFFSASIFERSWVDANTYGSLKRIYSTMYNPNLFAGFLIMNISFFLPRFIGEKESLLGLNLALSTICLILTSSRGAFAALIFSLGILFITSRKKVILGYMAMLISMFLLYSSFLAVGRAAVHNVLIDSSSLYRVEIWKTSLALFLETPIAGNGIGTNWFFLSDASDKLLRYVAHAHNLFLQIASEMGLLGLAATGYFLMDLMKGCISAMREGSTQKKHVYQGFFTATIGVLVQGVIDAVILVPSLSLVYMIYYGIYQSALVEDYKHNKNSGFFTASFFSKSKLDKTA